MFNKQNSHQTKIYAYRFRVQTVRQIGRNASLVAVIEINKNKYYENNTTYDGIYLEDAYGSYKNVNFKIKFGLLCYVD